jgi:hypothetical protein
LFLMTASVRNPHLIHANSKFCNSKCVGIVLKIMQDSTSLILTQLRVSNPNVYYELKACLCIAHEFTLSGFDGDFMQRRGHQGVHGTASNCKLSSSRKRSTLITPSINSLYRLLSHIRKPTNRTSEPPNNPALQQTHKIIPNRVTRSNPNQNIHPTRTTCKRPFSS